MDLYEACENGNEERVVELLLLGEDGAGGARLRPGRVSVFGSRFSTVATADRPEAALPVRDPVHGSSMATTSIVPAEASSAMVQERGTAGRTPLLAACMGVQVGVVRLLLGEPCVVRFTGRSKEETETLLAPLAHEYLRQRSTAADVALEQDPEESPRLFDVTVTAKSKLEQIPIATVRLPPNRVVAPRDLMEGLVHVDDFGNTPLQCASCFGCGSTEQHIDDCLEITRLLLAHGDQPNLPKLANKWTPLHWSAYNGNHEQTAILLSPDAHVGATAVAKTQYSIPLMVNDANLFPVDVAGRRGLVLMEEMQILRSNSGAASFEGETDGDESDVSAVYTRWRLRLDHVDVLKLLTREFVDHATELQQYVNEMNSRVPMALLRGKQHAEARKKRFTSADAIRYGQHLLYWVGCFGLVDELRALLRLKLKLRSIDAVGQHLHENREEIVSLQPLYTCSCEENKRQSVLHAVAALGKADIVTLLLQEILDAQRQALVPGQTSPAATKAARSNVVVPSAAGNASDPNKSALLDVAPLAHSGWTNHRNETPQFLAALFLRHDVVEVFSRFLSPASTAWELATCSVEGSFIRHVANHATKLALGIGSSQSLVSGEYVMLFDGVTKKPFKESLIETLREDSATAPLLVVTRAGTRETQPPRWTALRWLHRPKRTDYLVVGVTSEVLTRHAEGLQLKVKHRGSAVRSKYSATTTELFEPFRSLQRQQVVLDIIQKNVNLKGHLRRGNLAAVFPLHDASGCKNIIRQWVRTDSNVRVFQPFWGNSMHQFLLERRTHQYEMLWPFLTYFGEKHAFYYVFVTFYTVWLLLIAVPGALCQLLWLADSLHFVTPLFAVVVSIWATLLVERWKRKKSEIQSNFGNFKRNRTEEFPEFYGDFQVETLEKPVVEVTFPKSVQLFRIYCGLPVLLSLGCTVVAIFVGVRTSQVSEQVVEETLPGLPTELVPYLIPLLNAVSMIVLDYLYTRVARALTRWENHRTVWQYESMLAAKLFWFKFLNAFISLFWVAFVDQDAANLRKQLTIVMGVRQVWYMAVRNVVPLVRVHRKWKAAGFHFHRPKTPQNSEAATRSSLGACFGAMFEWYNAELASDVPPPDLQPGQSPEQSATSRGRSDVPPMVLVQELMQPPDFLMDKQMEIILQFGYITMFVSVLPVAPLLALFNNVITTRLDVISCTQAKQRPPFESETEVQTFMSILEFMSFAAVAVNCGVLFFTVKGDFESLLLLGSNAWADSSDFYIDKLWMLLIIEHVVLGAKALLSLTIDDSAAWVQHDEDRNDEEDKKRFLRESKAGGNPSNAAVGAHNSSHNAPNVVPAPDGDGKTSQRPQATVETMVDELLAQVAEESSAPLSALSLASLERLNRIVAGKLAGAITDRDQALAREREAVEKLDQAMRALASRPQPEQSVAGVSISSTATQDSGVDAPPLPPQVASGAGSSTEGPSTDHSVKTTSWKNPRQCFLCFALGDVVTVCAKRCLSCRVFLCRSCDATLHLDDLGVAEPTHFRVNVPHSDELEHHGLAPMSAVDGPPREVETTPLHKTLRGQIDAFVARNGRVDAGHPLALDAGEMLRRCAANAPVALRFLRNCERRRALGASSGADQ